MEQKLILSQISVFSPVGENTPLWEAVSAASQEVLPAWSDFCEGVSDLIPNIPRRNIGEKREKYLRIIKTLLEAGADLEIRCHGSTPLRMAIHGNDFEIVKLLLEKGANPNAETLSVLSKLARKEGRKTMPAYYDSVLHEAVEKNSPLIVRALLEAGAESTRLNHEGKTPLQIARDKGFGEIVKLFDKV